MKIKSILIPLILFAILPVSAQNLADAIYGKKYKKDYMGQYNYNGKRKNGFGIERYRNGSLYIGDFSEDKISGRGMLITNGKDISNVEGAVVYIGGWRDGKKSGSGVCYNHQGEIVFEGKFSGDKPTEKSASVSGKQFRITEIGQDLYFGEMLNNVPEGFGLFIQEDGCVIYGTMKEGKRQGIGMTFYSPEVWEVGVWKDGEYRPFNNSQIDAAKKEDFRASNKAWKKEMRNDLWEAASNFAQAGITTLQIVNEANGNTVGASSDSASDGGVDVASGRDFNYYKRQYDRWDARAKDLYEGLTKFGSRTKKGDKHTSGTSGEFWNSPSYVSLKKNFRDSQFNMKKIRNEAKRAGHTIPKSQYETVTVSY